MRLDFGNFRSVWVWDFLIQAISNIYPIGSASRNGGGLVVLLLVSAAGRWVYGRAGGAGRLCWHRKRVADAFSRPSNSCWWFTRQTAVLWRRHWQLCTAATWSMKKSVSGDCDDILPQNNQKLLSRPSAANCGWTNLFIFWDFFGMSLYIPWKFFSRPSTSPLPALSATDLMTANSSSTYPPTQPKIIFTVYDLNFVKKVFLLRRVSF